MEKDKYIREPLHLVRCMGELAIMYLVEKLIEVDDALDVFDSED